MNYAYMRYEIDNTRIWLCRISKRAHTIFN
jgi:hypothetical protein